MSERFLFSTGVRQDDGLRASFNELTRLTFSFDFNAWYQAGHWSDLYVPHVLLDGRKVVSNVSVNHMVFRINGTRRHYIQLGTVMTHPDYRRQGLNRRLMEKVISLYAEETDGIYLFANDSVLDYYPKFGFRAAEECEYFLPGCTGETPYQLEKADVRSFPALLSRAIQQNGPLNPNDGLYMLENVALYQFWMQAGYDKNMFFLPECRAYVCALVQDDVLHVHQIWGSQALDLRRLSCSFGIAIRETVLHYTPAQQTGLHIRPYREEDCTLFFLRGRLPGLPEKGLRFPAFSHA